MGYQKRKTDRKEKEAGNEPMLADGAAGVMGQGWQEGASSGHHATCEGDLLEWESGAIRRSRRDGSWRKELLP